MVVKEVGERNKKESAMMREKTRVYKDTHTGNKAAATYFKVCPSMLDIVIGTLHLRNAGTGPQRSATLRHAGSVFVCLRASVFLCVPGETTTARTTVKFK